MPPRRPRSSRSGSRCPCPPPRRPSGSRGPGAARPGRRWCRASGSGCPCTSAWYVLSTVRSLKARFSAEYAALALGHHHQAAGADVQAVHDPLPLGRAGGGDAHPGRGQRPQDGRTGPARARVGGHADGLVDDDQVVVLVDHDEAVDRLGLHAERRGRVREPDLQPGPRMQAVRLGRGGAVDLDRPLADQVGGPAAGQAEQPAQGDVDPLALQPLRAPASPCRSGHRPGAPSRHRAGSAAPPAPRR